MDVERRCGESVFEAVACAAVGVSAVHEDKGVLNDAECGAHPPGLGRNEFTGTCKCKCLIPWLKATVFTLSDKRPFDIVLSCLIITGETSSSQLLQSVVFSL
jgi:hypothetical protein